MVMPVSALVKQYMSFGTVSHGPHPPPPDSGPEQVSDPP